MRDGVHETGAVGPLLQGGFAPEDLGWCRGPEAEGSRGPWAAPSFGAGLPRAAGLKDKKSGWASSLKGGYCPHGDFSPEIFGEKGDVGGGSHRLPAALQHRQRHVGQEGEDGDLGHAVLDLEGSGGRNGGKGAPRKPPPYLGAAGKPSEANP